MLYPLVIPSRCEHRRGNLKYIFQIATGAAHPRNDSIICSVNCNLLFAYKKLMNLMNI